MCVYIHKAGADNLPPGVNGFQGRRVSQIPNGGNLVARDANVRPVPGIANSVDHHSIYNFDIKHDLFSFPFADFKWETCGMLCIETGLAMGVR